MTESSTTILRRLLDERDEYYKTSGNKTWWGRPIDRQTGKPINVFHYQAQPMGEDRLFVELQLATPEQAIAATLGQKVTGDTSDGYHTFNELYHHRAVLFSVIVRDHRELAWKSMRHHDGTMYDGMFIVGIETPEGQATYHYDIDPYWDMFNCKELDQAPEWDGHTPSEAIERIATLGSCNVGRYVGLRQGEYWERTENSNYYCGGCGWKVTDHDSYCPECGGALHNATLGSCNCPNNCTNDERTGTCHIDLVGYNQHEDRFQCRSCDWSMWFKRGTWPQFNYCPNCGRKVVDA